jgi:hypothetical protein
MIQKLYVDKVAEVRSDVSEFRDVYGIRLIDYRKNNKK